MWTRAAPLLILFLLAPVGRAEEVPPYSPELPYEIQRLKRNNAVRATLRDYDARLQALYDRAIARWQADFLAARQARLEAAGIMLARKAASIRDERELDWNQVGRDPGFRKSAREQLGRLLQADELRGQLTSWADEVERQTRQEMLRCFQQMVAYDLGLRFDEKLRGKVAAAVLAIPVEDLLSDKATGSALEEAIVAGLPGVAINEATKRDIAKAAAVLAGKGVKWVAVAKFKLPPTWAEFLGAAAGTATGWLAKKGLEWIDRSLSGEPEAARMASQLRLALEAFNEQHLLHRLRTILHGYRGQVIDFLEAEGRRVTF